MRGEDRPTIAFRVAAETRGLLKSLAAREGVKLSKVADTLLAAAVRERIAELGGGRRGSDRTFRALLDVARARAKGGRLSGAERRELGELARLVTAAVQQQDRDVVERLVAPRPR